jgi:hypothetical protein
VAAPFTASSHPIAHPLRREAVEPVADPSLAVEPDPNLAWGHAGRPDRDARAPDGAAVAAVGVQDHRVRPG